MRADPVDAWLQGQAGVNPRDIELGLDRVGEVWERLGAPAVARQVISVGGTNGKGSAVALLEAMLLAAGYRVGCYTSPHLQRHAERVRIGGVPVTDDALLAALRAVAAARAGTALTYFELGTLAALQVFAAAGLDVAVLEVGLGGRLDAVNLIDADAALVVSVDLDHQDWLGPDRETIGREKAGIFRAGRPAVCGDPNPPATLVSYAAQLGADLWLSGRDFRSVPGDGQWDWQGRTGARRALPLPGLRGAHQLANATAVLAVLQALAAQLPVAQQAVRAGLLGARLRGRFEVTRVDGATWVLDVAHNPAAARALRDGLAAQPVAGRTHALLGMLRDKDAGGVAAALADQVQHWHLVGLDGPRGAPAVELRDRLAPILGEVPVSLHPDLVSGLNALRGCLQPADRALVCGSFVTVGGAMDWLDSLPAPPGEPV